MEHFLDKVNPWHYRDNSFPREPLQCIDVCRHLPFCLGNAVKYIWRAGKKDGESWRDDLDKAMWYIHYHEVEMGAPRREYTDALAELATATAQELDGLELDRYNCIAGLLDGETNRELAVMRFLIEMERRENWVAGGNTEEPKQ